MDVEDGEGFGWTDPYADRPWMIHILDAEQGDVAEKKNPPSTTMILSLSGEPDLLFQLFNL